VLQKMDLKSEHLFIHFCCDSKNQRGCFVLIANHHKIIHVMRSSITNITGVPKQMVKSKRCRTPTQFPVFPVPESHAFLSFVFYV
jgi:hypothetical protein